MCKFYYLKPQPKLSLTTPSVSGRPKFRQNIISSKIVFIASEYKQFKYIMCGHFGDDMHKARACNLLSFRLFVSARFALKCL